MTEKTALKTRLRNIAAGARVAKTETKKVIKQAQTEMVEIVEEFLPPKDRAKFIRTIKNIQSQEQLDKKMPEVIERIETLIEKNNKRILTNRINKELKSTKTTSKGAITRGKFTAETQRKLDQIKTVADMSYEDAKVEQLELIEKGELTPEQMERLEVLNYAGVKGQNTEQLQDTLNNIESVKQEGKTIRELRRGNYMEDLERTKGAALEEIGSVDRSDVIGAQPAKGWWQRALDRVGEAENWIHGIDTMMEKLSTSPIRNQGALHKLAQRIHDARSQRYESLTQVSEEIQAKFDEIYSTQDRKERRDVVVRNQEELEVGTFTDAHGDTKTIVMSQNQAYKVWQWMQAPYLDPTFENMGWTPDMKQAVEEYLFPDTKEWAQWQLEEFYPNYYKGINEVYSSRFNVDLPFSKNYSPIYRDGIETDTPTETLLINELKQSVTSRPGSLKKRVGSTKDLKFVDGDDVLMHHVTGMEHFKAFEEPLSFVRSVFTDPTVRRAIEDSPHGGKNANRTLDSIWTQVQTEGKDMANAIWLIDKLRVNHARANIGLNPGILPKQLTSIPAFITQMPGKFETAKFFRYAADFWTNPLENTRTLMESPFMRERYDIGGMERDVKLAMQHKPGDKLSGKSRWRDAIFVYMKIGDRAAILQGGWAVYKSNYDQLIKDGFSETQAKAKAMKAFERATAKTQQSGLPEDLSRLQTTGGSWAKVMSMYLTQPQQFARVEANAIRNLAKGRGSVAQNARDIAIMHFLLPMMFQYVADGFRFDEERQLRAAIVGPINAIPAFGNMVETIVRFVAGDDVFGGGVDVTIGSSAEQLLRGLKSLMKDDPTFDDISKGLEHLAISAGEVTGYPVKPVLNTLKGGKAVALGEPLVRLLNSPYSLDQEPDPPLISTEPLETKLIREIDKSEKERKEVEKDIISELKDEDPSTQLQALDELVRQGKLSIYREEKILEDLHQVRVERIAKEYRGEDFGNVSRDLTTRVHKGEFNDIVADDIMREVVMTPEEKDAKGKEIPGRAKFVIEKLRQAKSEGKNMFDVDDDLRAKGILTDTVDQFIQDEHAGDLDALFGPAPVKQEESSVFQKIFGSEAQAATGSILDNLGPITAYGSSYWKPGLDVDLQKGDPVPSPVSGTVVSAGWKGGFGKQVIVEDTSGNQYWLSHLDGVNVRPGQKIAKGTLVGAGGNTGNVIRGPGGDGSHLDVTIKTANGKLLTARQVERVLRSI